MPTEASKRQYLKLGKYFYLKDRDIFLCLFILYVGDTLTEALPRYLGNKDVYLAKLLVSLAPLCWILPFILALIWFSVKNFKQSRSETKLSQPR